MVRLWQLRRRGGRFEESRSTIFLVGQSTRYTTQVPYVRLIVLFEAADMTIGGLPAEIWCNVLDCFATSLYGSLANYTNPKKKILARLCLVSKAMCCLARTRLYRYITVRTDTVGLTHQALTAQVLPVQAGTSPSSSLAPLVYATTSRPCWYAYD